MRGPTIASRRKEATAVEEEAPRPASKPKERGNGAGSVYVNRRSGRWEMSWWISQPDGSRKRKTRSGFESKTEAQRALRQVLAEVEGGPVTYDDATTVTTFVNQLIAARRNAGDLHNKSYQMYDYFNRVYIGPSSLGTTALRDITAAHVNEFLDSLLTQPRYKTQINGAPGRPLARNSVRKVKALLSSTFQQALAESRMRGNPMAAAVRIRVDEQEIDPLSQEDLEALMAVLDEDPHGALYRFCLGTGVRQAEALGLRGQDVNLETGLVSIFYQLQKVEVSRDADGDPAYAWSLRLPKRGSARIVALPEVARTAFLDEQRFQAIARAQAGRRWGMTLNRKTGELEQPRWVDQDGEPVAAPGDLVFLSKTGTPLDRWNVTHRWQALLCRLGLQRRMFHVLRHTNATLLTEQGLPEGGIQQHLGHRDKKSTRRYTHWREKQVTETARLIDRALRPAPQSDRQLART